MSFSTSIQGAMITRCISAGISASASTLLVLFIWKSKKGLKNPYSRIIFGLSLGDILQSLGMLISPFAAPSDPGHIFGMGSVESCDAVGFFFTVGSLVFPWYTLTLTYYFLKRVKYKVSSTVFAKREEKWLHIVIWTYSLVVGLYAVAKGQINPTKGGSICYIASSPIGCEKMENEECVRGEGGKNLYINPLALYHFFVSNLQLLKHDFTALMTAALTTMASLVTIFVALFFVLGAFTLHVYQSEKLLQPTGEAREALTSLRERENAAAIKYAKQAMELKLTKSAIAQSSLYIVSFFFVYSAPCIAIASGLTHSETMFWWISIFLPCGGLFNMLVYTRPKVKAVRKVIPDLPYFIAFFLVLLEGGETPNLMDLIYSEDENRSFSSRRQERPSTFFNSAVCRLFGFDPGYDFSADIEKAMREECDVDSFVQRANNEVNPQDEGKKFPKPIPV